MRMLSFRLALYTLDISINIPGCYWKSDFGHHLNPHPLIMAIGPVYCVLRGPVPAEKAPYANGDIKASRQTWAIKVSLRWAQFVCFRDAASGLALFNSEIRVLVLQAICSRLPLSSQYMSVFSQYILISLQKGDLFLRPKTESGDSWIEDWFSVC